MYKRSFWRISSVLVLFSLGVLALATLDLRTAVAAPDAWVQGPDLPMPDAFYGSIQCPDDPDSFYVVAGWEDWFMNRDEVWRFDADTFTWTQLADYPEELGTVSVTCYQGFLYGAGGNLEGADTSFHFYRYDIANDTWTQLVDLPRKQNGASLAVWDGYMYLIGGDDSPVAPLTPTPQVDRYNLQTGAWEMNWGTPMPVLTIGDWLQVYHYLYIVGGFTTNYPTNSDATLRYDLDSDTWEIGPSFTSQRAMVSLDITSQYLYAIGGDMNGGGSSDATDLVERLDLSTWPGGTWVDISDPIPEARGAMDGFCSEAVSGGEIWSVGGLNISDAPTTSVYYRPSEPCYTPPYGLILDPPADSKAGYAGETITYTMSIENIGINTDVYMITVNSIWMVTAPATVGPLTPGAVGTFEVVVDIPPDATPADSDTASITAISVGEPAIQDISYLTSRATEWHPLTLPQALAGNLTYCPEQPNVFYLVAGVGAGGFDLSTLYQYDIGSSTWTQLAPLPAPSRAMAVTCYQGKIYVGGGSSGTILNKLIIYDITSNTWTSGANLPTAVWGAQFGAWDGKLYLIGGSYAGYPYTPTARVDVYTIASDSWDAGGGTNMPFPASFSGAVQRGFYMYIVGGYSGQINNNVNQTQIYNMATGQWEIGPEFTSARAIPSLVTTGSHLYALGGDTNGGGPFDITDLVEELDLSGGSGAQWIEYYDALPLPNIYPASYCSDVLVGGEIWAIGGADQYLEPYELGYYHATEPCISYGVNLPDEPLLGSGEPGATVEYLLTITNTGVVTDYYTISVSTTWGSITILGGPGGPIPPSSSIQVIVAIPIPWDVYPGDLGTAVVTATSMSNPAESDTAILTASVTNFTTHMPFVWKN